MQEALNKADNKLILKNMMPSFKRTEQQRLFSQRFVYSIKTGDLYSHLVN